MANQDPEPDTTEQRRPSRESGTQPERTYSSEDMRYFPRGYPELAACMNTDIDFVMFRRFGYLHLRHLLYLQEELSEIERRMYHQDLEDPEPLNLMSRKLDTNTERKSTMTSMIVKLKEYDEALKNYQQILNAKPPTARNTRHFHRWFTRANPLIKEEANIFRDIADLTSLQNEYPEDALLGDFVAWLSAKCSNIRWLNWILAIEDRNRTDDSQLVYTSDKRVLAVTKTLVTAIAALLLLIPIIILYYVHTKAKRLLAVALFTIAFSSSLSLLTRAKTSEIFAATAAYAAVMVVFIGSPLSQ